MLKSLSPSYVSRMIEADVPNPTVCLASQPHHGSSGSCSWLSASHFRQGSEV